MYPTRNSAPARSPVIVLPVDCSVRNITALREQLCSADTEGGSHLTLDLDQVERFDTATLQLIAAFARDGAARGVSVLTRGARPAWDEAADLLGLTAALNGGG
jgi:anti-anti-sigma regulatory factor